MIEKKQTDLWELVEAVKDEASFLIFLQAMADDFALDRKIEKARPSPPYSPGPLGWENGTIDTFLDAAVACSIDNKGRGIFNDNNVWRRCAEIIFTGKYYE